MPEGFCPNCGTLFVDGVCPECKGKKVKQTLIIHLDNGNAEYVHGISEKDFGEFLQFAAGLTKYNIWDYKKEKGTLYVPRQSVSYFRVKEVTE